MAADKVIRAEVLAARKLVEEAEEAAKPKKWLVFSSAPDYMDVAELFNRAGNAFKSCQEWEEAASAFLRSAEMERKAGEVDESARKLLSAASCLKKCNPLKAVQTIESALDVLLHSGRFHLAASHEKEVAELYETQLDDPQNAIKYYERAAERYAGEDSSAMAQNCRLKAASLAALSGFPDKAALIYEDAASESVSDQLRKYSVRDYLLRAGICRLAGEDRVAAKRCIDGYPAIDASFGSTREFKLLTDILTALDGDDMEAFTVSVTTFDKTNALDDWKTKMLLKVKKNIDEEPGLT